jgi:endo-1,4-beta-xylanase
MSIIENHVTKPLKRYKGRCYALDVVNEGWELKDYSNAREPLADYRVLDVVENGTWLPSVFFDIIGPAYVPIALAAAAKVDRYVKLLCILQV